MIRLLPKLALSAAAALGIYVATTGLPLPESCADPSPSCGGDLRECLRQSADMRQTTFGGRYVTAEDVARCTEAFNSCISGGASNGGGGTTPSSSGPSSSGPSESRSLPKHFSIAYETVESDCKINGQDIRCTDRLTNPPAGMEWTQSVSGTLSGSTMTGTVNNNHRSQVSGDPGCFYTAAGSGSATYVFNADGTVNIALGDIQTDFTYGGTCPGSRSYTYPAAQTVGRWSELP